MFQPGSLLAPPAEFHLERLRRPALEAPNPHAEGSRLWILLEESKAEHTPLSEDRPYVPLSVYERLDVAAEVVLVSLECFYLGEQRISVGRDAPQLLGGVHERFGGSSAPICPAFSH